MFGDDDNDDIRGGPGRDFLTAPTVRTRSPAKAGRDQLNGDDGDDTLAGGSGDDTALRGGDDDDALDGGPGTDALCQGAPDGDVDDVDTVVNCE